MKCLPTLLLLAACDPPPRDTYDDRAEAGTRTYDTAGDPASASVDDPELGFSADDVHDALLGSFSGTYTANGGDSFAVDVSMSVDGLITVMDFTNGCDTMWSAPLVFAMSSEQVGGEYLIDDLWSHPAGLRLGWTTGAGSTMRVSSSGPAPHADTRELPAADGAQPGAP